MMHVHVLRVYWTLVVRVYRTLGLQLKRFLTSLFAHAREPPAGMVSCSALFRTTKIGNPRIKVQVFGLAGPNPDPTPKVPVPVSVGTWPLLNRASWVQPPYDGGRVHAARDKPARFRLRKLKRHG